MKKREVTILSTSRTELELSVVDTAKKIVLDSHKTKWDPTSTEETSKILEFLKTNTNNSKIRILLRADAYYLLELPYKEETTRKEVFAKVSSKIPEDLEESSWDYKVTEDKKIIAFAPVKEIYEALLNPLNEAEKEVEAVEPEEIALQRNENPIIGIALKTDLRGKDSEVLNLEKKVIKKEEEKLEEKTSDSPDTTDKSSVKKNAILIVVIILLLGGAVFMLVNYSNKVKSRKNTSTQVVLEKVSKSQQNSEKEGQIITEAKILILATNTEEGENAKEILSAEGFGDVELEEAEGISSEKTYLQVKRDTLKETTDLIVQALNSEYDLEILEEPLDENEENSVLLKLGQRIITTN